MTTILNLDWDDTTHQVHANTVIDPETGRTRVRLTITVTGFNITLNMSVLFAVHSLGHPSFAYIPVSWDIKLFDGSDERSINELPVHESLVLVILRGLAIQRGIQLAIDNDYIGETSSKKQKTTACWTAPRSFSCDSAQSISGTSWKTPSAPTSRRCNRRATITDMSAFLFDIPLIYIHT